MTQKYIYECFQVELNILEAAYKALVAQTSKIFNKRLWYIMFEQFLMKYVWSGAGMVMVAIPLLTSNKDESMYIIFSLL